MQGLRTRPQRDSWVNMGAGQPAPHGCTVHAASTPGTVSQVDGALAGAPELCRAQPLQPDRAAALTAPISQGARQFEHGLPRQVKLPPSVARNKGRQAQGAGLFATSSQRNARSDEAPRCRNSEASGSVHRLDNFQS